MTNSLGTTTIVFGTAVAEAADLNLGLFFGLQRDFDVAEKLFRESRFYYRAAFSDPSARGSGCWDFDSAFFCFSLSL